jgi:hypothetical protein
MDGRVVFSDVVRGDLRSIVDGRVVFSVVVRRDLTM